MIFQLWPRSKLQGVRQIRASGAAFAALLQNGASVLQDLEKPQETIGKWTWGIFMGFEWDVHWILMGFSMGFDGV